MLKGMFDACKFLIFNQLLSIQRWNYEYSAKDKKDGKVIFHKLLIERVNVRKSFGCQNEIEKHLR